MNKTQEALKMAIEALEDAQNMIGDGASSIPDYFKNKIQACKEALAELEQTKQLGVVYNGNAYWVGEAPDNGTPLYTTPPKRECGEAEQSAEIAHYKAQINELREALICIDEDLVNPVYYRLVKEALDKTAPQCLQEHDNEVIERCAKICDEMNNEYGWGKVAANTIRLLKGKQNES